ncbi:MAG: hypothetical protein SWK76_03770 [Actinomycetota bacterium]|nr:hypothetical protein [Actinomycetota bacterium]
MTVLLAGFVWILAANVYLTNRKAHLNRILILSLVFIGIWFLSGFMKKILEQPSDLLTLWTFRRAYAAGGLGLFFYLLFFLILYLRRLPGRTSLLLLSAAAVAFVFASLSP